MIQQILFSSILLTFAIGHFITPTHAQSGCALQINEIMYHPAAGTSGAATAEWVELFVAQEIMADTTFFITDLETGAGNLYSKAFTVPAGTAMGSYIVVHNDGDPANDGQTTLTGIYTTISFFIGNGTVELNNGGDEIALYVGADATGTACDFVEYEGGNTGIPAGFVWDTSCIQPNSNGAGLSISLDPNGAASDSECDWVASGNHSPNHPDLPITGAPHTMGWSNNTTPTAVTIASFTVQNRTAVYNLISVGATAVFAAIYLRQRRKKNTP